MKKLFYPKLAWTGIRKNKRLYLPYILTCAGMVMMFYIVAFLSESEPLFHTPGGSVMQSMLDFGMWVITVFALIFLFYTNSFLTRRRKKEFGLYNILGMGKRNLAQILIWEGVIVAILALSGGLLGGIACSKLAELGMVNILQSEVTFTLLLSPVAVLETIRRFLIIFGLILLHTLWQIYRSDPIELLHSEHAGEKPPKANWLLAILGAVILGAAYYLAVSIQDPVSALLWFFVAVIMVIVATYLLFVAGSVTICRILQKNKKFYYKTNHFVSVSSMVYRMKRNGAGLASICILCTMVLVMMSGTVCLYIGTEDSLRSRYPRNINVSAKILGTEMPTLEAMEGVRELAEEIVEKHVPGEKNGMKNVLEYRSAETAAYLQDGHLSLHNLAEMGTVSGVWQLMIVPLEDYNRLMGKDESLEPGETIVYTTKSSYSGDSITLSEGKELQVRKVAEEFVDNGVDAMQVFPTIYLFVSNPDEVIQPLLDEEDKWGNRTLGINWNYAFDLKCGNETQVQIQSELAEALAQREDEEIRFLCEGVAENRAEFYGLYGALFFLGVLLGIVFVFAAVLIIYYKQISEGYEDQSRFEIMQKVGMTQREIRQSVNSQVLTVFFLPLLSAGMHLIFAFPMIHKLLVLFSLTNVKLLIGITVGCYLVFALFYVLVYRGTSRAYYHIVSGVQHASIREERKG